jgi:Peptidase family S41
MSRPALRSLWLVVLTLALASRAAAQSSATTYEPAAMAADLARFHAALRDGHAGLDDSAARVELDRVYAGLREEVRQPKQPMEFFRLVLRLTASVHDGHTSAFTRDTLRNQMLGQGLLPFHVIIQHDRIFVLRNLSDARFADGSEILSIDGVSSPAILARLADHLGVDGGSASGIRYRLGSGYNSFYQVYPQLFGYPATYRVVLSDHATRAIRIVDVPRIAWGEFARRDHARYGAPLHTWSLEDELKTPPLELRVRSDSGYALLRIRRFFKDSIDEGPDVYLGLLTDAFRRIADARIRRLVIDLRGNGGGDGANVARLLTFLVTRPFTPTTRITFRGDDAYYARFTRDSLGLDDYFGLRRDGAQYTVTRAPDIRELSTFAPARAHRYSGALAVLIDGGTVSAAGMAAGLLQELTSATLVGEEAGGYAGMSNGIRQLTVVGEHTQIGVNFPLAHSEFAVNEHRRARGALPDFPVTSTIDDLCQARDAPLDRAIKLIRSNQAPSP